MNQTFTGTTPVTIYNDPDEAPELTQADFAQARFQVAGQPVSRTEWQVAVRNQVQTCRIALNIEVPIIEHLKSLAGERGYEALINRVLAEYVRKQIAAA